MSDVLVAVDPAVKQPYCSVFVGGVLIGITDDVRKVGMCITRFAIEIPKITGQTRGKDPNDMLLLTRAADRYITEARGNNESVCVQEYGVNDWKGSTAKPIYWRNAWAALSKTERRVLPPDTASKIVAWHQKYRVNPKLRMQYATISNYLDSIGIGLFHCGRVDQMGRVRTPL